MLNKIKLTWKRFNYRKAFRRVKTPQELFRAAMLHGIYITQYDKNENILKGGSSTLDPVMYEFYQRTTMCSVISQLLEHRWIDEELHEKCVDEIYDFMRTVSSDMFPAYMHTTIRRVTCDLPQNADHEAYVSRCIKKIYHHWDDRYELIEGMKLT